MPKQLVSSLEKSASWHQRDQNIQLVVSLDLWIFSRCPWSLRWKKLLTTLCLFLLYAYSSNTPHNSCWCLLIARKHKHQKTFFKRFSKLPREQILSTGKISHIKRQVQAHCCKALAPFRFWTRGWSVWMDRKCECLKAAKTTTTQTRQPFSRLSDHSSESLALWHLLHAK